MIPKNFSGSAEITAEGIKKHFNSYEPYEAIFELIWNGLDANGTLVQVQTTRNSLNRLDAITVLDNGDGIDVENTKNNFEKFNESSKRFDDDKHGSHGKGRLAFHKLCEKATWYTKTKTFDAKISVESSDIKSFFGAAIDNGQQHALLKNIESGTCVELSNFVVDIPSDAELKRKLSHEFGWFLALNKTRTVQLNGVNIEVPIHLLFETVIKIGEIDFSVRLFQWGEKPSSELSYNYIINSQNKIVSKEHSKFNKKVNYYTSTCVFSPWINTIDLDGLELSKERGEADAVLKSLAKELLNYQSVIYNQFLRSYVDDQIDKYESGGFFPKYEGMEIAYAQWRKQNTKSVLREIYLADPSIFNKINAKQAKILIRLLDRVLVSNESDGLYDILDGVLDLNEDNMESFAKLLRKTTLENIVSTIEILHKRQVAVHKLKEIMENRFDEVLETPDLQKIIENNTWLFGPQYTTLGAEEANFQVTAKNLRDYVKDISIVSNADIAEGASIEGVNRQVDLFLARRIVSFDSGQQGYKCIIIEIKRPGISLNNKHLQQLDGYAEIIAKHSAFGSEKMTFELILVGRKISKDDYQINQRINNLKYKCENGLVSDGRIKCYVKNWFTIFDEFELSNNFLLDTLKTKLDVISTESTDSIVTQLQTEPLGS